LLVSVHVLRHGPYAAVWSQHDLLNSDDRRISLFHRPHQLSLKMAFQQPVADSFAQTAHRH
jgi:hypothetical protein